MKKESKVKYLGELGINLQNIITRLLKNKDLLKLLYYTDKDPLGEDKADVDIKAIYKNGDDGLIRIVPVINDDENSNSIITLRVIKGSPSNNESFLDIYFVVEIFVPNKQWIIASENLRPYAIMGEVQKSLDGKSINGLGKIKNHGFDVAFFSTDVTSFVMKMAITQFD